MFKITNNTNVMADHEAIGFIELGALENFNSKEWCSYILHHYTRSLMEWLIENKISMKIQSDENSTYITIFKSKHPEIYYDPYYKREDNYVQVCIPNEGWVYYYHK